MIVAPSANPLLETMLANPAISSPLNAEHTLSLRTAHVRQDAGRSASTGRRGANRIAWGLGNALLQVRGGAGFELIAAQHADLGPMDVEDAVLTHLGQRAADGLDRQAEIV